MIIVTKENDSNFMYWRLVVELNERGNAHASRNT